MKSVIRSLRKKRKLTLPANWGLEDELLRNFRLYVLDACYGNRQWASVVLGISLRSLRMWLAIYKQQGVEVPSNDIRACALRRLKGEPQISNRAAKIIREWTKYYDDAPVYEALSEDFWTIWRKNYVRDS